MSTKTISQSPTISDTIEFTLTTTDSNGNLIMPYMVNSVVIYFLVRDSTQPYDYELSNTIANVPIDTYFSRAQTIATFGNDDYPAWLSTDTQESYINATNATGEFQLVWQPQLDSAREGDYIICWTWTPIVAADTMSNFEAFFLLGSPTSISLPTHNTDPNKYPTLLTRYLPEYVTIPLGNRDLTPDILTRLNAAIGGGFTFLETLGNRTLDLLDANSIPESLLLYLANTFDLVLRSDDPTLWRRQIKNAIPLYKQKGTVAGLSQALSQAGITFVSWTQLWQVASPWTWQESFLVSQRAQTTFQLSHGVYSGIITNLAYCPVGNTNFTVIPSTSISSTANIAGPDDDGDYWLNWIGQTLNVGDTVLVTYCLTSIANPSIETYIRSLPLADQRDFTTVTFPPLNWNVYVIEETDPMFNTICPTLNPFAEPVVYGQVRTEFPYSENIYNMEEYNASLRNSNDPCDLSQDFVDDCSCCISSKFNINIEIEDISSGRINEATEIINEYKPFHSIIHQMNYQGSVNEFMPPQVEEVEVFAQMDIDDHFAVGNDRFYRVMNGPNADPQQMVRNALASITSTINDSGWLSNSAIVIYTPGVTFDEIYIGPNAIVEILSGPNTGMFNVGNPQKSSLDLVNPVDITLNPDAFPFRLSMQLFGGSLESITEEHVYIFSDPNNNFRELGVMPPSSTSWQIQVGLNTFTVMATYPDDTLLLSGWVSNSSSTEISYQLLNTGQVTPVSNGISGVIQVTTRGLVYAGTDFADEFNIKSGDWLYVSSGPYKGQYEIIEVPNETDFYIAGWNLGTVVSAGLTNTSIYARLLDNVVGYLNVRGLTLTTTTNYESELKIQNGANNLVPTWTDDLGSESGLVETGTLGYFKETFLILIGLNYYTISDINGSTIALAGPQIEVGTTPVDTPFTILQFTKTLYPIPNHNIVFVDRRNGDMFEYTTEQQQNASLLASALNRINRKQTLEYQVQSEGVTIEVQWKD